MLGSLARAVWRGLIYGTRCWTMRFGNLLHVGKLMESAFDMQRITAERRRKDASSDAVDNGGRVLHHLCWANDLYSMSGKMVRLTRDVEDMTTSIEWFGMQWKEGPHYCCGDIRRVDDGFGAWWKAWRRWARGLILVVVQRLPAGTESLKATSSSLQRKLCFVIPRFLWRGVIMPSTGRVLRWFMELANGRTRSPCFKRCASGVFLCLRRRTNETWVDHTTRTGPDVARPLKKHGQPRVQTLDATCSAVCLEAGTPPDDARERSYWEESVNWRCDDEWRRSYIKLTRDDPRNSTKWKRRLPGRATFSERPFTRLLVMPGFRKSRPAVRGQSGTF